jgi:membrane protease YdiL (CAAX protease family)
MAEPDRQTVGYEPVFGGDPVMAVDADQDAKHGAEAGAAAAVIPSDSPGIIPAELVETTGGDLPPGGCLPGGLAAAVYRPPPPRIWTVFLAAFISIPAGIAVSLVIGLGWLVALHGPTVFQDQASFPKRLEAITMTPAGLVGMVIPGQAVFFAVALFGALLSPQPWRERLRVVRGRWPVWTWIPLALATPAIANVTSLLLSQVFDAPSEHLRQMEELFRRFDEQWLFVLFLLVAGLPGFAEEFLFRGYIQSRLTRAWPPFPAIMLSGLLFGAAHLDPMHSIAVMPLGVWLGLIAYRCDSLWPAVIGHVVNNGFALAMMRFFHIEGTSEPQSPSPVALALIATSYLSLVASVALVARKDRVAC